MQENKTKMAEIMKNCLFDREPVSWTTIALNVAVVGNSGTGKSSFINALRGLKAKQSGAANVGVNETTVKCQPYTHPDNKKVIVWDLPGVGTPKFPKGNYLKEVEYDKYDFFIIMSRTRFTENDLWLALEAQKRNKTFFFVRSNIDKDITDDEKDDPDNHDEETLLQTIREHTENELKRNGVKVSKVFLINNRQRDKFDFGKLNNELLSSCNSMALVKAAVTKEVMVEKKRVHRYIKPQHSFDVASCSGEYEQKSRFQNEMKFYHEQFAIAEVFLAVNKDISDQHDKEFQVAFDQYGSSGQFVMPTAMKAQASTWEHFVDLKQSKEEKLIYSYCGSRTFSQGEGSEPKWREEEDYVMGFVPPHDGICLK